MLFLAAKRRSRPAFAFIAALSLLIVAQFALFGRNEIIFYATQILPRSLEGETLNPYHPSNSTFVTLFRRLLVAEPALNPHPLFDSAVAFAFVQCAFTLSVLLLPALAAWNRPGSITKTDLAWWSIALLLVSPNTASYTFVLLALPVVLLLDEWPRRRWPYVLMAWILLALPLTPVTGSPAFPLGRGLSCFFPVSCRRIASFPVAQSQGGCDVSALCILAIASVGRWPCREIPGNSGTASAMEIAVQPEGIYSSSPIVTASGIFYESIAPGGYVVQRRDGATLETFAGNGNAFHPSAPDSGSESLVRTVFRRHSPPIAFFDLPESPVWSSQHGASPIRPSQRSLTTAAHWRYISNGALYVSARAIRPSGQHFGLCAHDPFFCCRAIRHLSA